jgi:hypothetical protein
VSETRAGAGPDTGAVPEEDDIAGSIIVRIMNTAIQNRANDLSDFNSEM